MKVLTVIFTLVLGTAVWAQEGKTHHHKNMTAEEKAEKMTARMTEELKLSDTQKENVYAINLKYTPQFKAVHEKDITREEMHKEMKPLKKAMAEEYKQVLSEEQWKTFEANKKAKRSKMKGHHKKGDCHQGKKCEPKECEKQNE